MQRTLSVVAGAVAAVALAVIVGLSWQIGAEARPLAAPTPGPDAMTVYAVTNPNSFSIAVRHVITDSASFRYEFDSTIPANSTVQYHLRDMPNIPSPFDGAMTLSSDQQFTAEVVGYDYPGSPSPTATQAPGGALLISNTSVASGKTYLWDELAIANLQYIDRSFAFSQVPAGYIGLDYLRTANDDKGYTSTSFLSFDVNQDVTVYVAHDERISPKPSWLSSFTATSDTLVSGGGTFRIFAKDFSAGTVTLGGNGGGSNSSMYSVLVRPRGTSVTPTATSTATPTATATSTATPTATATSTATPTNTVVPTGTATPSATATPRGRGQPKKKQPH